MSAAMCACDHDKCRKDCRCPCHTAIEKESDRAYKVGQSSGLDEAAVFLMKEATSLFAAGFDGEAKMIRKFSDILKKRADERHPGTPV